MFGLIDDYQALADELKKVKEQLHDLKVLVNVMLECPDNVIAKQAVKIALKNIEE